jgi:phosphoribosylamine--glycine ligase
MKVLVIGSGGREHAICYAFRPSPRVERVYCASGNAGIASIAECVNIRPDDVLALADFAASQKMDLTFVGGETALALGIVDEFVRRGLTIVGPIREAATLESSKAFAKDFMARYEIPTAKYAVAHSAGFATLMLESGDFGNESTPVVVKADGLAAGKGVVVAKNRADAIAACDEMESLVGSAAAQKIILEECLVGREVSLLAFVDGEHFALMPPVRDHKRIGEGDTGPNTGGMGTVTDASLLTDEETQAIVETILRPTIYGCKRDGFPFRGVMFLGLMMTDAGPNVLEYNVRFGDPEAQAILVRLETDLVDICEALLAGRLNAIDIQWQQGSSACVVLAAEGYPGKPRIGDPISGLEAASTRPGINVFHSATALAPDDAGSAGKYPSYLTAGGRVLGVTATADSLTTALDTAYAAVGEISWPGMQYRKDIGKSG